MSFTLSRAFGGSYDHPTPVAAMYRLRLLILGQKAEFATSIKNAPVQMELEEHQVGENEQGILSAELVSEEL